MQPFTVHEGLVVPLDRSDVDTDQIIPKQFLKRIERTGFGQFLFYDWRFQGDGGAPEPDFVLNRPRYAGASVLLTRANFGCGSSREHAPWALHDYGFRVVVAPSFADIFFNNCFKNGMLPVVLPAGIVDDLFGRVDAGEGYRLKIDLPAQTLTGSDGFAVSFEVDPFRRRCLLEGLDDVGLTLAVEDDIADYESARAAGGHLANLS